MSRFDAIKATIDAGITQNGNQEITGKVLNNVMKEMVSVTEAEVSDLKSSQVVLSQEEYDALEKKEDKFYFTYEEES